jgi:beta-ureidopropionase
MASSPVKCGLIQASNVITPSLDADRQTEAEQKAEVLKIRDAMIEKHLPMIDDAAAQGVQILCLQEIFAGPYFCAEAHRRWYFLAEDAYEGHTVKVVQEYARKHGMIIVVPIYEEAMAGLYYNTAAVIDGSGKHLGIYRKNHIPDIYPSFQEKFYFKPGDLGYPTFRTDYGTIGVYICYDRHFPEGARALALNGADIIFNPSATISGLSQYLWELEQPAHAVANGFFVGAINRVGTEEPWKHGHFYGSSYFCNPRGQIVAQANDKDDAIVVADLDFDEVRQVRNTWQFFRDRRADTYGILTK